MVPQELSAHVPQPCQSTHAPKEIPLGPPCARRVLSSRRETKIRPSERGAEPRKRLAMTPGMTQECTNKHSRLSDAHVDQPCTVSQTDKTTMCRFSEKSKLLLQRATNSDHTDDQWTFYTQNGYLLVTEHQWLAFGTLLDQIQDATLQTDPMMIEPRSKGAALLPAHWMQFNRAALRLFISQDQYFTSLLVSGINLIQFGFKSIWE